MAKKTSTRSAAKAAPKPPKIKAADKVRTKTQVYTTLSEQTGLTKKQVASVFDAMQAAIAADLGKSGPGVFNVPGMMKVRLVTRPATKARKGRNPATGEEITIKAKPARKAIRIRPLKNLKELI